MASSLAFVAAFSVLGLIWVSHHALLSGRPAVVLISADDHASIGETLEILATSGARDGIAEARADAKTGRFVGNDEIKALYGRG